MSESISSIHVSAGMRRLLASEATSNFGSMLSRLAIPWIAALVLDATPLQMAWLVIADVVAGAVGSLFVGSLVDRTSKKNLMIGSDVIRAAVIGAVAVLLFMESLSFWILVLQSAANGVLAMVFSISRSAWLAEHVPHGELTVRNSQMSAASSTSESVAFASGGWIYQWLGPMVALVSDVASYLISALCLRGLPEKPQPIAISRTAKGNWIKDVFAGFRLVAAKPVLRCLAVCDVFLALGFSITGASYLIFVSRDLAFETGPLGLIFATGALGSLAGAAMASRLGSAMGSGNAVAIGLLGAGLGALLIPLAPTAGLVGALLLIGHQIIGDSGSVVAIIHSRTLRQIHSPAAIRGRVDAALRGASQLATLLGALAGGALATMYGTRVSLWLAAGIILVAAPLVWGLFRGSDLREIASPPG